jgi:hypothetical protein
LEGYRKNQSRKLISHFCEPDKKPYWEQHDLHLAYALGLLAEQEQFTPTTLDGCPMFPGFPVELGGAGELLAAFLTESRTRESG